MKRVADHHYKNITERLLPVDSRAWYRLHALYFGSPFLGPRQKRSERLLTRCTQINVSGRKGVSVNVPLHQTKERRRRWTLDVGDVLLFFLCSLGPRVLYVFLGFPFRKYVLTS